MPRFNFSLIAIALCSTLILAGCESDEEKAERYFQSGMALLQEGDEDRALVEFRNVFKYDGFHKEARRTYADVMLRQGHIDEAYSQYLRLIEQYPDTVDVRRILAELAIIGGGWSEAERHGAEAIRLAPDQPEVQAIKIALDYHKATMDQDDDGRKKAADEARVLLEKLPDNRVLRRILIDYLVRSDNPQAALPEIDRAIEVEPKELQFYKLKLHLLLEAKDIEAIGNHMEQMQKAFPDDPEVRDTLVKWYLSQRQFDEAEEFLRQQAGEDTGPPDGHLAVIQFLDVVRDKDTARGELDRLIKANEGKPNADLYLTLRAGMDFEAGQQSEAIATVEGILRNAPASEQTNRVKLTLAKMLERTGNRVGARARVEEVLADDQTNVEALKMRAAWLIDEDRPKEAIVDLRTALGQAPRDASVLLLMAAAHERDGDSELAGERLAAATEVSGAGAVESLAYARFLLKQDKIWVARRVLTDALRTSPANVEILSMLAGIHVNAQEWPQAQELLNTLKLINSDEARNAARTLQAAILAGQGSINDSLAFLEEEARSGDPNAVMMAIRAQIRIGKLDDARKLLDSEIEKNPDNAGLRFLSANLRAASGDMEAAEAELRELIAKAPQAASPVQLLYNILRASDRDEEAGALLDQAMKAQPGLLALRLLKAERLEQAGDYEGAIAAYTQLYDEDSSNMVVANNLASLLTSYHDDPESLDRALAISRRLRDSDVPQFKDTYGWIEYRRGNYEEALTYLEPAAAKLPDDAITQLHLGLTYKALSRKEDAVQQIQKALDLAGDSQLPPFQEAREVLESLSDQP